MRVSAQRSGFARLGSRSRIAAFRVAVQPRCDPRPGGRGGGSGAVRSGSGVAVTQETVRRQGSSSEREGA
jgi:hypothetical protein